MVLNRMSFSSLKSRRSIGPYETLECAARDSSPSTPPQSAAVPIISWKRPIAPLTSSAALVESARLSTFTSPGLSTTRKSLHPPATAAVAITPSVASLLVSGRMAVRS